MLACQRDHFGFRAQLRCGAVATHSRRNRRTQSGNGSTHARCRARPLGAFTPSAELTIPRRRTRHVGRVLIAAAHAVCCAAGHRLMVALCWETIADPRIETVRARVMAVARRLATAASKRRSACLWHSSPRGPSSTEARAPMRQSATHSGADANNP